MTRNDKTNAEQPLKAPRKRLRVEVLSRRGEIARPFEDELQPWLDAGWQRKEAK